MSDQFGSVRLAWRVSVCVCVRLQCGSGGKAQQQARKKMTITREEIL